MRTKVPASDPLNSADTEVVAYALELCAGLLEAKTGGWENAAQCFEAEAARCRMRARTGGRSTPADHDLEIEVSKLIQDWHRAPQFVDDQGAPVPLAMRGPRDSIESLAKRHTDSREKIGDWLKLLQRLKAVRKTRDGRFLPVSYTLMIGSDRDAMQKRGIKILGALVAALSHNLSEPDPALREFERCVHSTHVKEEEIPAFRQFLALQGRQFIKTVDDWVTAREDKSVGARSHGGAEIIVEVVSHVSFDSPRPTRQASRKGAKAAAKRSKTLRITNIAGVENLP